MITTDGIREREIEELLVGSTRSVSADSVRITYDRADNATTVVMDQVHLDRIITLAREGFNARRRAL